MPQYSSGGQFGGSPYNNPQMNQMQNRGIPGPQGPPQGQQMPGGPQQPTGRMQPGGYFGDGITPMFGGSGGGGGSRGNIQDIQRQISAATTELQRAQMLGMDPMSMQQIQAKINGLKASLPAAQQQAQIELLNAQKEQNELMAPHQGVGGATSQPGPGQQRNSSIDMQILALMLGIGGGGRSAGPVG